MPRTPKVAPIVCEHFTWYLRRKSSGVYFADGRINSKYSLGKPSLGTRDREEALRRLRDLDLHKAIEVGLFQPNIKPESDDVEIEVGWQLYMKRCEQPEILEGVSPNTRKRYAAVRDKHIDFCRKKGYQTWAEMTKKTTKEYGTWLAKKAYADRTIVLELNLICSAVKWLVEEEHLPPGVPVPAQAEQAGRQHDILLYKATSHPDDRLPRGNAGVGLARPNHHGSRDLGVADQRACPDTMD